MKGPPALTHAVPYLVFLIQTNERESAMTNDATESATKPRPRVVVGIDASPASDEALRWAFEEAVRRDANLEVVIAWDFVAKWAVGFNPEWPEDADHLSADATTAADKAVDRLLAGEPRPNWLTVHAVRGTAALVLTEHARHADLLVVGSRGRGGFSKLLLGSVSNACVHHASCPIVVIPTGSHVAD